MMLLASDHIPFD